MNEDLDQEELEYLLSIQAAQQALDEADFGLVLVAEVETANSVSFSDIECVFECTPTSEESDIDLVWYGPTELEMHIDAWSRR